MKYSPSPVLAAALLALSASAQAATTTSAFTDRSQLDLNGRFVYAVTMNADAAGTQLGDATFTYGLGGTAGVSVDHAHYISNWYGNASDPALGSVMQSIAWTDPSRGQLVVTMSGLTVGQTYQTQLLFSEGCCDRGFDVWRDRTDIAQDFSTYLLNGRNGGTAYLRDTFTATSTSINYVMGGDAFASGLSDPNPVINAFTLENISAPVPEPASGALLLSGLAAMGWVRRRRG